jgi:hypothetical protein
MDYHGVRKRASSVVAAVVATATRLLLLMMLNFNSFQQQQVSCGVDRMSDVRRSLASGDGSGYFLCKITVLLAVRVYWFKKILYRMN